MDNSIIYRTDSYKPTHWPQYPKGTTNVYSYMESRGGKFPSTVAFGYQYYLKKYLQGQAFDKQDIYEAYELFSKHYGNPNLFNIKGWEYIWAKYKGRLPVVIKAVPEGYNVPVSNALMTIENTDDNCSWLVNYLESLLVQSWYPTTVATYSREIKKLILKSLVETGNPSLIDYKLHDFGFRGVSSVETAGIGGLAHLVNFKGTDTLEAILYARKYYNCDMAGHSIPASEHSTITSWGEDHEVDAMRNMLESYPTGLVACVSDSYNIFRACKEYWGGALKEAVLKRDGCLVVRPDSGYPPEIIIKVLQILDEQFGSETNDKGFKVLNPKVRVIQGDGIDYEMVGEILKVMKTNGFSADNIAFGSGGGLLQKHNRDTQKFAFKCSSVVVNGVVRDVYKNPVTDQGKMSKRGRLRLVLVEGIGGNTFRTLSNISSSEENLLKEVFRDGNITKEYTLDEVRANSLKEF